MTGDTQPVGPSKKLTRWELAARIDEVAYRLALLSETAAELGREVAMLSLLVKAFGVEGEPFDKPNGEGQA